MLDEMPAELFMLWAQFERVEPYEHRADLRAGIIAARVADGYRDSKKHPDAFSPEEMLPWIVIDEPDGEKSIHQRPSAAITASAGDDASWDRWFDGMKVFARG
jgi:hypothetical protein